MMYSVKKFYTGDTTMFDSKCYEESDLIKTISYDASKGCVEVVYSDRIELFFNIDRIEFN